MERPGMRRAGSALGLQKSSSKRLINASNEAIHTRSSRSPWRARVVVKAEDAMPPSKRTGARKSPGRGRKLDLSAAKPKEASYRVGTEKDLRPYRIKPLEEDSTSSGTATVNSRPVMQKQTANKSWRQKREERARQMAELQGRNVKTPSPAVDQGTWQAKLTAFQQNEPPSSPTRSISSNETKRNRFPRQSSTKSASSEKSDKSNSGMSRVGSLKNLFSSPSKSSSHSSRSASFSKINAKLTTLKNMLGGNSAHKLPASPTRSGSGQKMRVKVKVKSNRPVAPPKDPVKEQAATKLQAYCRMYLQRKRFLPMVKYQRKINKLNDKLASVEAKKEKELAEIAKVVQEYKDAADAKAKRRRDALALRMKQNSKQNSGAEQMIEQLKKDNYEIQLKNDVLMRNSRNLCINNLRLEKSSESSKDYFDQLELHHSRCVEDNEKLTKVAENYQKKVAELQGNLDTRSRYNNAEHRTRALYRKTIQKIISKVEETDDESLLLHLYELQSKIDDMEKKWTDPEPLSPTSAAVKKKFKLSMRESSFSCTYCVFN